VTGGPTRDANGNLHGDDGRFVSLREYFERVFREHEKMHDQLAEGIQVAREAQNKRLDSMNEFRAALQDQAGRSITREVFESAIREREAKLQGVVDRIVALEKSQVSEDSLGSLREKVAATETARVEEANRQRTTVRLAVAGVVLGVAMNFIINLMQGGTP
jgi:hypothetical protein